MLEYLLAVMMTIMQPGSSENSRMLISDCGEKCKNSFVCENEFDFRCKKPRFDQDVYKKNLSGLVGANMSQDLAKKISKKNSYTIVEPEEVGFIRYFIIAEAIEEVSEEMSRGSCIQSMQEIKPCNDDTDECVEEVEKELALCQTLPWPGDKYELAKALLVVTSYESGWMQSVSAGTNPIPAGDCRWASATGERVKPWSEGSYPLKNTCKSWGLAQANFGGPNGKLVIDGEEFVPSDIIGLQKSAVKRALQLSAIHLSKSYNSCYRRTGIHGMFSQYGSGSSCSIKVLKNRTARYNRIGSIFNYELEERYKEWFEDELFNEAISFLRDSDFKVEYIPPEFSEKILIEKKSRIILTK